MTVRDELAIRLLGLLGELALTPADFLEVIRGGSAFLAPAGGHSGAELELAELLLGQRWTAERVVFALDDQMPAEHRELAGGRNDRDLHPTAGADPLIERAQWSRRLDRNPRRLDEHPARVRATLLGDPPVACRRSADWRTRGLSPR